MKTDATTEAIVPSDVRTPPHAKSMGFFGVMLCADINE